MSSRDDLGAMKGFVEEFDVGSFEHIADEQGDVWATYGITTQPAFVFIDDTGSFTSIISALGEERIVEELEALL